MNLLLLGASGNIGQQTLEVIYKDKNTFTLTAFSVGTRTRCICGIISKNPQIKHICLKNRANYNYYKAKYPNINFYYGDRGLIEIIKNADYEMVVNALVGFVGLVPTIEALKLNKIVALANKESLVVGGEIINELLSQGKGKIYPIDSEHVAISKCLKVDRDNVKKIILTASGGAFRNLSIKELENVTVEDALNHPTWSMGRKITIDSATMMNKCFEVIEAYYLFGVPYHKIDILMHKESYVHSLVEYKNGLLRAEISKPDMRNPIKYALYQENIEFETSVANSLDDFIPYQFSNFDINRFPLVRYSKDVCIKKGYKGVILNAANEVAVNAFLENKIAFNQIDIVIDKMMNQFRNNKNPSLEKILKMDKRVRKEANKFVSELGGKQC